MMTQMDEFQEDFANEMKTLAPGADLPVAPAHGIAALALNMSLKYHDINMVKDGALYQQYKLEGKNFRPFTVDEVFETAMRMEAWLLGASDRIAKIVIDCVKDAIIEPDGDDENSGQDGVGGEDTDEGEDAEKDSDNEGKVT
jgi:hypothetical protein